MTIDVLNLRNRLEKNKSLLLGLGIILIAILISLVLTLTRTTSKRLPPAEPSLPSVTVVEASLATEAPMVTATARVAARQDINIVTQVSGVIVETSDDFARGAFVEEGSLLVNIDDQDYQTALAQAEASLAQAQQTLATEQGAARQAQRQWRDLGNQAANDLFLRKPQIAAAQANLNSAKANLQQAQTNLDRTKIRAPFSGTVTGINANLGQFVSTGSSLTRLVSSNHLEIAVPLTLNEIIRLGFHRTAQATEAIQREVEVIYNSGFQESFSVIGQLVRMDPITDRESQVRFAIVEIKDDATPVSPGELVKVNIPGNAYPDSMWLPERALFQRSQVMTVENGQLTPVDIRLLDARDNRILVSGLRPGIQIVIDRPVWTGPGTQVKAVLSEAVTSELD